MARAYRCDRCPNLYEEHKPLSTNGEIYETGTNFYRVAFDLAVHEYKDLKLEPQLCPPCRADILNAIASKIRATEASQPEGE